MLRAFEMIAVVLTLMIVGGCASSKSMARSSDSTDNKSAIAGMGRSRTKPQQPDARTQRQPSAALIASELEQGYRAERAGNPAAARLAYERVLKYDPGHARAHHRLAIIADNARKFPEAEQHYLAALRKESQNSDLLSDLGYSYQLQKRDADSERVLREALTYNPKHRKALYNLGVLQANRGQYNEALASFQAIGTEAEARQALAKFFPDGPPKSSEQLADAPPRNPFLPGKSATSGDARARQLMAELEKEPAETTVAEMDSSKGTARAAAWGDDMPGTTNVSANPQVADRNVASQNESAAGIANLEGGSPDSAADSAAGEETDAGPLVASFDRPATEKAGGALVDPAVQPAGGTASADSAAVVNAGGTAADWEQARVQAAQIGLGAGTCLPLLLARPPAEASLAWSRQPVQDSWSTASGMANIDSLPAEFPTAQQPFVRSR